MIYVQLGFIQNCINWIVDNIISPVFETLSNITSTIFKTVFEKVLQPLFVMLWGFQYELIKRIFLEFITELLYRLEVTVLTILNAVERGFRVFAGLEPVYVKGKATGSLLLALAQSGYIMRAFFIITFVSILLCIMFAILGTVKSMGDMEGKLPIGKVMRATARSLLILILIPMTSLFFILLGDAILKQIDIATKPGRGGIADTIFVMSTLDAVKESDYPDAALYNSTSRAVALKKANDEERKSAAEFGLNDKYRKPFYDNGKDAWSNEILVKKVFDLKRMDFVVGIGGGVLFIYLIGTAGLAVVARIFDILTLLVVQPFFAATMPLDDGERHKKWMDMFLAKLVSGYGLLVGMNVYLGISSLIISGKVRFFGEGTTEAVDYLVRLLFLGVGAYAVLQAGPMVTSIMNVQAGRQEGMALAYSSDIMATPAGALAGMLGSGINNIMGRVWNRITGKGGAGSTMYEQNVNGQNTMNSPNTFGQPWNQLNAYNGQDNAFMGTRPALGPYGGYMPMYGGTYTPPAGMFGAPSEQGYSYASDIYGSGTGAPTEQGYNYSTDIYGKDNDVSDNGSKKQSMADLIGAGLGDNSTGDSNGNTDIRQSMMNMLGVDGKVEGLDDADIMAELKQNDGSMSDILGAGGVIEPGSFAQNNQDVDI